MPVFRPRELLEQAQKAESRGELRAASNHYATLGRYLISKKRWADAITALEKAVALSPAAPRLYLLLGLAQKGRGDMELARSAVVLFTRRATQNRKFRAYQAYILKELQAHPDLREMIFKEHLNFDRTSVEPFLLLFDALSQQERWIPALATLLDATQLKERISEVAQGIEKCLAGLGRNDQQIFVERFVEGSLSPSELRTLLETGPVDTWQQENSEKDLGELVRALENKLGVRLNDPYENVSKVVREFRSKTNEILGTDGRARLDMATAFKEMNLWKEALEELSQVSPADPCYWECQFLVAETLRSQGSDLAALESYQALLRHSELSDAMVVEARYQVIQLYVKLGDFKEALQSVLQLEKRDPDYRELKSLKGNIQQKLRQLSE